MIIRKSLATLLLLLEHGALILNTFNSIKNNTMERKKYAKYLKMAFRDTFDTCGDTACTVDEFCKDLASYSAPGNLICKPN